MRIRLQVSVALAFAALTLIVLTVTVGLFFRSNRDLAIETARDAMASAQAHSEAALTAEVAPVIRVIGTASTFAGRFPDEIADQRGLDVIAAEIAELPSVYSVFVADDASGDFVQVVRVLPGMTEFGITKVPVPQGTLRVLRLVDASGAAPIEQITFVAADGRVLSRVVRPTDFDPRTRPWYEAARKDENAVVSPIYVFASSGRPGVTLSNRFTDAAGVVRGVVGVDMSLDTLSGLLAAIRVDGVGEIVLLDHERRLIASSETGERPLTEAAQAGWDGTDGAFFRVGAQDEGGGYLVSMARMQPLLGTTPTLGVIVPRLHFVGSIATTTKRVIALSAAVGLVALATTVLLARLLSQSLRAVAVEARRISAFELDGQFEVRSRITEVAELGAAVANMKNSLGSFGAYVPKDVVRSLVAAGGKVAVGGTSREVTLLFSDIEGFTRKSEALPPEVAMRDLSRYFEAMAQAVASHGGTVDKYIGDAVMAIWSAPVAIEGHAGAACRGALACKAAEAAMNAAGQGALVPTRTRIGLHSDRVVVGNVGSANRLQYTAIGGAVNLASRVEGLNKHYGTAILATQAVVDAAGSGFVFREVDLVSPAGTTRPVALHELLGETGAVDQATLRDVAAWGEAMAAFRRQDWAAAAVGFRAVMGGPLGVVLPTLYLDRCARLAAAPPGADWSGVTVLSEK